MKVILLEDVKSLGKKGDVVDVSDGYAKNFLLKGKKGVEASGKNLNDLKLQKQHADKVAQENYEQAQALAKEIEQKKVTIAMQSGVSGKVFGSVSTKEIALATEKQTGLKLDKKKIQLTDPIKALGNYEVIVKLHPKVTAKLAVTVVAKEES